MEREREICALRNELATLRQRIDYLERQLFLHGSEPHALNTVESRPCAFCQQSHTIRTCEYFKYLQISDRWTVAKKLKLCFRCLDNSNRHLGRDCPNTKVCRIHGCRLLHHRLLHDPDRRKLRAGRYRATNPCEHSCENIENVVSDFGNRSDDSEVNGPPCARSMNSLDSYDDIDNQQMDELNRLAMLAEQEVPFEMVFSGSCRDKSQLLRKEYMTFVAPSGGADSPAQSEHFTEHDEAEMTLELSSGSLDSLDSFSNECAPPEGQPKHDEPSNESLNVDIKNNSVQPSECEIAGFEPEGNNGTGLSENNGFIENRYAWLTTQMEKSGMFYNRRDGHSYTSTKSLELQKVANDVALQQLAQKYGTDESTCTLLDTLSNQINRLDKEILFYETIVSPDPPAEVARGQNLQTLV